MAVNDNSSLYVNDFPVNVQKLVGFLEIQKKRESERNIRSEVGCFLHSSEDPANKAKIHTNNEKQNEQNDKEFPLPPPPDSTNFLPNLVLPVRSQHEHQYQGTHHLSQTVPHNVEQPILNKAFNANLPDNSHMCQRTSHNYRTENVNIIPALPYSPVINALPRNQVSQEELNQPNKTQNMLRFNYGTNITRVGQTMQPRTTHNQQPKPAYDQIRMRQNVYRGSASQIRDMSRHGQFNTMPNTEQFLSHNNISMFHNQPMPNQKSNISQSLHPYNTQTGNVDSDLVYQPDNYIIPNIPPEHSIRHRPTKSNNITNKPTGPHSGLNQNIRNPLQQNDEEEYEELEDQSEKLKGIEGSSVVQWPTSSMSSSISKPRKDLISNNSNVNRYPSNIIPPPLVKGIMTSHTTTSNLNQNFSTHNSPQSIMHARVNSSVLQRKPGYNCTFLPQHQQTQTITAKSPISNSLNNPTTVKNASMSSYKISQSPTPPIPMTSNEISGSTKPMFLQAFTANLQGSEQFKSYCQKLISENFFFLDATGVAMKKDGIYLVRPSSNKPNSLTLCVKHANKTIKFPIEYINDNELILYMDDTKEAFSSVRELIDIKKKYPIKMKDETVIQLKIPAVRR